jgi:hypothetical protein
MDETQVIEEQVDAFNARDLERFLSLYASDVVIEDGASNGISARRNNWTVLHCRPLTFLLAI